MQHRNCQKRRGHEGVQLLFPFGEAPGQAPSANLNREESYRLSISISDITQARTLASSQLPLYAMSGW